MGYHTNFTGEFKLDKPLTVTQYNELQEFADDRHERGEYPGYYCQWVPKDETTIAWDGQEKFYNYVEWIEYLIKTYLTPWNINVNGRVTWQGSDMGDLGVIDIVNSVVNVKEFNLEKGEFISKQ